MASVTEETVEEIFYYNVGPMQSKPKGAKNWHRVWSVQPVLQRGSVRFVGFGHYAPYPRKMTEDQLYELEQELADEAEKFIREFAKRVVLIPETPAPCEQIELEGILRKSYAAIDYPELHKQIYADLGLKY